MDELATRLMQIDQIPQPAIDLSRYRERISRFDPVRINGHVIQVVGLVIEAIGPSAMIGELCRIAKSRHDTDPIYAEVVGFRDSRVLLMPIGEMEGIKARNEVIALRTPHRVSVGPELLGRVLNGFGTPMDDKPMPRCSIQYPVNASPPNSLRRNRITQSLAVGIRSIDGLLTIGKGQRMGIFAGSGVGKSTLLGMVARNTAADVNVIALTGERGREVRDFIEENLGEEGLKRSVVVVSTSDQPPILRLKSAMVATAIAEYFRDQGRDVMLILDSLTRLATAQRDVGLAIGEPPATRGYTPSVFALLPRLLERAGNSDRGSITGLYSVLVDGDDMNEPVADTARGILDGHIVLSRALANAGHYPAIDLLQSVSRVMNDVISPQHQAAARTFRSILSVYREAEDLSNIGAYVEGSNPIIDTAKRRIGDIRRFLQQTPDQNVNFSQTQQQLISEFDNETV